MKLLKELNIDVWTKKGWNDNSRFDPVLGIDILS